MDHSPYETLVLNLYAGPGSGKSTLSAGVFSWLKSQGVLAELVLEQAKDLVWAKRFVEMDNQIYLFALQHHSIWKLLGNVEVIVVDGPLLHSLIYDNTGSENFRQLIIEEHRKLRNLNIFVERAKPFQQAGRVHDEEQSRKIDAQTKELLSTYDSFLSFPGLPSSISLVGAAACRAIGKKFHVPE